MARQHSRKKSQNEKKATTTRPKDSSRKRVIPKKIRKKIEDISVVKSIQGHVVEDIRFDNQGPPSGYTFVPKGDAYMTRTCRSRTQVENHQTVFTVYSSSTYNATGIYVPSEVKELAAIDAATTAAARKRAVDLKDARDMRNSRQLLEREFPSMPESDVEAVLNHAFLKGSRRVGRSGTVKNEEKKVRLAVEAHIRHVHTEYEKLIEEGMTRDDARKVVWDGIKKVKAAWAKGDGE